MDLVAGWHGGVPSRMMPPSPSALGPGSTLGAYQLISRLALGGMAEIFLARKEPEAGFEKTVVLKRILPPLAGNAELIEMFLDEARLAAQLHHPAPERPLRRASLKKRAPKKKAHRWNPDSPFLPMEARR